MATSAAFHFSFLHHNIMQVLASFSRLQLLQSSSPFDFRLWLQLRLHTRLGSYSKNLFQLNFPHFYLVCKSKVSFTGWVIQTSRLRTPTNSAVYILHLKMQYALWAILKNKETRNTIVYCGFHKLYRDTVYDDNDKKHEGTFRTW